MTTETESETLSDPTRTSVLPTTPLAHIPPPVIVAAGALCAYFAAPIIASRLMSSEQPHAALVQPETPAVPRAVTEITPTPAPSANASSLPNVVPKPKPAPQPVAVVEQAPVVAPVPVPIPIPVKPMIAHRTPMRAAVPVNRVYALPRAFPMYRMGGFGGFQGGGFNFARGLLGRFGHR